ncbi:MAG TPA: carboxypeptidase-like regulatory domain-containing protein [Terriglobales bacterium]|nr:carboxypeptidase-like regulatory domain-containing protein [Terriglobales bacterium]
MCKLPTSLALAAATWLLWLACVSSCRAQLITVGGGSSDLYDANGASLQVQSGNYQGYVGGGELGGDFLLGTRASAKLHSGIVSLGDEPITLDLPTDIFSSNQFLLARGASFSTHRGSYDLMAFGGATAVGGGTPFFQAATADTPAGMLFVDKAISHHLHFYSREVFSEQQTAINGFSIQPHSGVTLGAAGGVGSNQGYGAGSLEVKLNWLELKAAYIGAGDRFRRVTVPQPINSEYTGGNILATMKPRSGMVFVAGHQNLLQPQFNASLPFVRATVDQLQGGFDFRQFRWGGGLFESLLQGKKTTGEALWADRPVTHWLDTGINYFRSRSQTDRQLSSMISGILRETVSPRLSLLQIIGSSQGQTTVSFGGNYFSNHFTVGVDYQTVYVPFLIQPFKQGIAVTLQLRPLGGIELDGQSFLGPDGKTKYSVAGSSMLYGASRFLGVNGSSGFRLPRYVIRGRVVDEQGNAIAGAAVRVDGEVLLTNAAGQFLVRKRRSGSYPMQVSFADFVNPLPYEAVSCPSSITAMREEVASEVLITLRRAGAVKPK